MNKEKQICTKCISDTENTPGISFDEEGVCNYCRRTESLEVEFALNEENKAKFEKIIEQVKKEGKGRKYDCVLGVSGGCDSSYLLYKLNKMGLRILAAHFDNTWNSDIATTNIYKILKKLKIDLYTHVVDNEEYDDIYKSFIKANVKDLDTPTDVALAATMYHAAVKNGVKWMFDGHSFRTEGIVPSGFVYADGKYVESVQKQFGHFPLKTYPNLWLSHQLKWMIFNRIKRIRPLYYMDYNKEDAKKLLAEKFDWKWYGGHHMENRFTYFTVNYYMFKKFNADLRVSEYSGLIRSGQITRDEGLKLIAEPKPIDREIIALVQKRLGISDTELEEIMNKKPLKSYRDYKTYKPTFERFQWFFWILYKLNLAPQNFYIKYCKTK